MATKEVLKVKVFINEKEDTEYSYPKGISRSEVIDKMILQYAYNNRIVIKMYGKSNKKLSEVTRRPTRLFGNY